MMGHSASLFFALATMTVGSDTEVLSVSRSQLPVGQTFEIQTEDLVYRGELVDRGTGECQLAISADGHHFTPARTVFLLGATAGRQDQQTLVLMNEVKVGLRLELGLGDLEQKHRYVTSEVKAIRLKD